MSSHCRWGERLAWARKITTPACLYCTLPFAATEPAIIIHEGDGDFSVYFHARCYGDIQESSRRARKVMGEMILGLRSWSSGATEIERIAPFRSFVPARLKFPKNVPDGLNSRRDEA